VNRRRAIAILALLGVLDSVYLLLAKLGYIGGLSCTISHSCDMVNSSSYSEFLGIPVSGIGMAGYVSLFVVALGGTQPRWLEDPRPDWLLSLLAGLAVVITLYLTYVELFILRAICQWCVVSQLLIMAIFVLSLIGALKGRSTVLTEVRRQALSE
jgi:uncharacterized membrane protein